MTERKGPLAGLKVLDLTIAMAGPMCTQRLGEMGAEIIKIEAPGGGDFSRHAPMAGVTKFGDAVCFLTLNRMKRSLVLNLKSDEGRAVLYHMVRDADVLVQNYRPHVAEKLGIDYATLSAINPGIVCGAITGYGWDGPMKDRPGQDLLLQSFTGLTFNGGSADGLPAASPLYMVDVTASHLLGEGILAALVARSMTGKGQEVKVSMLAGITEMQVQEITSYLSADAPPARGQAPQVSIYQEPPYGIYACAKGYLAISQADLAILAPLLDLPELAELKGARPPQGDAVALTAWRDRIVELVGTRLKTRPAAEWDAILAAEGIWCMVVNDYAAFLDHPQAQTALVEMEHPSGGRYRTVAPAIQFSGQPQPDLFSAPVYGADSREILAEAGYAADEIESLVTSGAVVAS